MQNLALENRVLTTLDSPSVYDRLAPMSSAKELGLIAALLVAAFAVGLLLDALAWALLGSTLVWITIQYRQFRRVSRWSGRPWRKPRNGFDSWFNIAYQPHRALQRERQRTRAATNRLRQILDLVELIPDGVIVLSPTGEIQGLNSAATRILQITERDIDLSLATIVRNPDFIAFLRAEPRTGEAPILEFTSPLDPEITLEARRIDTETEGTIVLIRDITTLNRLLTLRQSFVANVSHELRTPLAVVRGYMETITDPKEDDQLRLSLADRLDAPLGRMQSLVDDLMLLTQLESTDAEIEQHPVHLGRIAQDALAEIGHLNGSESRVELHSDDDVNINCNISEMHSVCANLIGNALRYSPEKSPIQITVTDLGERVRLSVQDQGVGIAPEHLDRLTERFYRVDMADARSRGGTGLGLAIVKHVLRRHGSALQIESRLGQGSTFSCDFAKASQGHT